MRLVQVAKALGMTGQELRHELSQVDFGIKPTDREIPDNLAQGIIRFIARKHGLQIDMEALGFSESPSTEKEAKPSDSAQEPASAPESKEQEKEPDQSQQLNILRKLTLEDVPRDAVKRQQQRMASRGTGLKGESLKAHARTAIQVQEKAEVTTHQQQIKKKEGVVLLPNQITVKEFAEKAGVQVPLVVQTLMRNGVLATITQTIDFDTAAIVADELGVTVRKEQSSASAEDIFQGNLEELLKDEPENLVKRPPVVVVMGHVDHGKTSILDAIRKTDVAAKEAGGITQHIGAYQVEHRSEGSDEIHAITFLDTPGHEAFTAMRARGAQVTDIAVIVVAADEGVKPTTIEAINHAKEAEVPMLVALNKMDREGADPDRVKGELSAQGLQPEEWGGKTPIIPCSAVTKMGITDLLDAIVIQSELAGYKANPKRHAIATVIESHLDPSHGPLGSVIVRTGTLRQGDIFVCGNSVGKVRAMMDARGERLAAVLPSGAVRVSGFDGVPAVGDIIQVVPSEREAKALLETLSKKRTETQKRSFVDLVTRLSEGKINQLKLVLKTDTQGSLEALQKALAGQATEQVGVKVIHGAVGGVTESDVIMAAASDGLVVAFSVPVPVGVLRTAEREGVKIREYDVIYALLEDVEGLLKGLVEPEDTEKVFGHIEVKGVFLTKKSEQIVGGRVVDGVIKRLPFRLMREGKEAGTGKILSLRHVDKDIKEAKEGTDCGMRVESSIPVLEGDVFEVYLKELKKKVEK